MQALIAAALCLSLGVSADASHPPHARAHILFETAVTTESVSTFSEQLNELVESGEREIVVEINTPGGSVGAGIEMSKVIERSPATVICVVDGMAASMGLYVLQSCDMRVMTSRSLLMGHQPAAGVQGQPDDVEGLADLLRKLARAMAAHVVHRMHISIDEYEALTAHGRMWWLTAEEALSVGAVDGVVVSARAL